MDNDAQKFILHAIETLSLAVMTGKYDIQEMDEIYQNAGVYLFDLTKEEEQ